MNGSEILTDVTTYISAEEYLSNVANNRRTSDDLYSVLSYAQLVQTLIFYDNIYVPHPMLRNKCDNKDFGEEQVFLSRLFKYKIIKPLNVPNYLNKEFDLIR